MLKKESKELDKNKLVENQIVWSEYYKCHIQFLELDWDCDYLFRFLDKEGYCVIINSKIYEPDALMLELY